jgi:hypothetical protein
MLGPYEIWLGGRILALKAEAHDRRMVRRANPVDNAAARAKRKYEATAKGQATRARYTNSVARLESKERYRSTWWGSVAIMKYNAQARVAESRARVAALDEELAAMGQHGER